MNPANLIVYLFTNYRQVCHYRNQFRKLINFVNVMNLSNASNNRRHSHYHHHYTCRMYTMSLLTVSYQAYRIHLLLIILDWTIFKSIHDWSCFLRINIYSHDYYFPKSVSIYREEEPRFQDLCFKRESCVEPISMTLS